jgi:hypothetical protein
MSALDLGAVPCFAGLERKFCDPERDLTVRAHVADPFDFAISPHWPLFQREMTSPAARLALRGVPRTEGLRSKIVSRQAFMGKCLGKMAVQLVRSGPDYSP